MGCTEVVRSGWFNRMIAEEGLQGENLQQLWERITIISVFVFICGASGPQEVLIRLKSPKVDRSSQLLSSREQIRVSAMPETDLRIVEALRRDGRATTNELAEELGLSRTSTARRLSQLLDSGAVSVVGLVHPHTLGIRSLAYISISVDVPVRRVASKVAAIEQVPFVSLASGAFPLVAEARVRDDDELTGILDRVRSMDGVVSTEALIYSELIVDVLRPSRADGVSIDRVDKRLLAQLQLDGRLSYTTLAARVGISTGTARTRVLRMIDEGVVRIGAIAKSGRRDTEFDVGLGISLRGPASTAAELLATMPGIRFLAATIGRYDVLATVHAETLAEVVTILDRIRGLRPVLRLDSWVHLDTVKESYHYRLDGGAS